MTFVCNYIIYIFCESSNIMIIMENCELKSSCKNRREHASSDDAWILYITH
ncbi:hypothetical protein OIU76_016656 [Salix suchowensis]|nr:hypothetical protein OIU76_016656 [Salix suchowensis]